MRVKSVIAMERSDCGNLVFSLCHSRVPICHSHLYFPSPPYVIPEKSGIQNIYCPHLFFVFFPTLIPRSYNYPLYLYAKRCTLYAILHLASFVFFSPFFSSRAPPYVIPILPSVIPAHAGIYLFFSR